MSRKDANELFPLALFVRKPNFQFHMHTYTHTHTDSFTPCPHHGEENADYEFQLLGVK